MIRIEGLTPELFPDSPRESRTAPRTRGGRRAARAASPRRRRARTPGEKTSQLLLDYWNEHAVKTGLAAFAVWFAAVNWAGLRGLPEQVLAALG
jgi:hypothetical protein